MKILLEDTIPFGPEYLAELGDIRTYAWQSLTQDDVSDADILAVRSTTKVNASLLANAKQLKFVTTATSGTNHLDKHWLDSQGISWQSAGGCNAVAVAEYVLSVLFCADKLAKIDLNSCTVGIVGAGHVGSALAQRLSALNINYKLCDPPLEASGDPRSFVTLDEITQCDVITLHVPFVKAGKYATGHLINEAVLSQLNARQLLINACRGEVIDEDALLRRLNSPNAPSVALDVFANEPTINPALLPLCWLVTPHIAGHSVEGKVRGTQIIYQQICQFLNKEPSKTLDDFLSPVAPIKVSLNAPNAQQLCKRDAASLMLSVYDVCIDDKALRDAISDAIKSLDNPSEAQIVKSIGHTFATMRKTYRIRRECSAYSLRVPDSTSIEIKRQLQALGFSVAI